MTTLIGIFTLTVLRLLIPVTIILFIGEMVQKHNRAKRTR
jgi:hypothetical protein